MLGYWVYMLASGPNGTLYVGVTSDLVRRVAEHHESAVPGFTQRYGVVRLVWYETHDSIEAAIRREKRLKKWPRAWKVALIETANPEWRDLWAEVTGWDGWPGRAGP
jgi:putative endonuclease